MLPALHIRRLVAALLFAWFLAAIAVAIACNLPLAPAPSGGITEQQFWQTLTALPGGNQASSTPTPWTAFTGTPVPPGTAQPGVPTEASPAGPGAVYTYFTQSGDTLPAIAGRFGVNLDQISASVDLPAEALLAPGQVLTIPNVVGAAPYSGALLPDSEVIYSPANADFNTQGFIQSAGGFLGTYGETIDETWMSGADIVQRIAEETSTNPRLLLAFLERRSGWVFGQPADLDRLDYPIGFYVPGEKGLYKELYLTAKMLAMGYYGWRAGTLTELAFPNGGRLRLSPELNAGSVAVQFLFSKFHSEEDWAAELYAPEGFFSFYQQAFGDPWARSASLPALLPPDLAQPPLELPFLPGERWSFTGGPHAAWTTGSPQGALDFAPVTGEPPCSVSSAWVTASAPGLVVRSTRNVVAVDLDGDGLEQTGWVLVYLHLAEAERVPVGTWLSQDDRLGHPSCERGKSTGTHVHLVRKYNGEWLAANGPLPFVLSGWEALAGSRSYAGYLVRGDQLVTANPGGSSESVIVR